MTDVGEETASRQHPSSALVFKGAVLPALGYGGVQAYTVGLPRGVDTNLFLFDIQSGALVAVIEVLYYDWLKTGATGAVAAKHLAPPGAQTLALFGTGRHGRSQVYALCEVLPITRVQAYSRNKARREAFCLQMQEELDIEIVPATSPEEALAGAEIVTTITTSSTPVFDGRLLENGRIHINAMGQHDPWAREVDDLVVSGSRVIVDDRQQALKEYGELLIPMEHGLLGPGHIFGDLGRIVAGDVVGRDDDINWTLFLSGGTGIEDVAVAGRLYELARQKGLGTEFEFQASYSFEL
jgi:alanine dehydrogenase